MTVTGGLDLFAPAAQISMGDYTSSMPAFVLPAGTTAIHQARTGIVPAAAMTRRGRQLGAALYGNTRVEAIVPGADDVELVTSNGVVSVGRVVVTADAWTAGLLARSDISVPLCGRTTIYSRTSPRQSDSVKQSTGQIELDSSYTAFPEASRSDLTITARRPTPVSAVVDDFKDRDSAAWGCCPDLGLCRAS